MKSEVRADCILEEYFLNMSLYPNQLPFCSYENEPSETKGRVTGRRFFFFSCSVERNPARAGGGMVSML